MTDTALMTFISFVGTIQFGELQTPLNFRARIAEDGEVEFDFGAIPITRDTNFILQEWNSDRKNMSSFTLSGISEDGTRFSTANLSFTSMNHSFGEAIESVMNPAGSCLTAKFYRKLGKPTARPSARMWLKGFQNSGRLRAECPLGVVAMTGLSEIGNPDVITGSILIEANETPPDVTVWRQSVDNLFDHVRRVMSFASAVALLSPACEYFDGGEVEVCTWAQVRQAPNSMRVIHYMDQGPIFSAAVTSHFFPPIVVNNLFHAIEWFAMDTTYSEVRLINAMTVLENLVASNLDDDASLILGKSQFKKIRRSLGDIIRSCLARPHPDGAPPGSEILEELNERLSDLNRRSIFNKLMILIERWSVPLDGITEAQIKAAKKARDHIVHTGHYALENDGVLWDHVLVIRELVVRFLLTAIGYKGRYVSFLDGMRHTTFPPQSIVQQGETR